MTHATMLLLVIATLVSACDYAGDNLALLRIRSAYDLQCQEREMRLEPLGAGTVGVSGCGHQATYVCANQDRDYAEPGCTWLANGGSP